jgi:cell wall-associated NlpC family hydrolase
MPYLRKLLIIISGIVIVIFIATGTVFAAAEKTGVITGDVVNFREKPSTSSKILVQLKKGTKVSVVASEGDWCQVSYSDTTGWVHGDYITVRDEQISAGVVKADVLNVRSKPDTSSEILTKLEKGTIVEIAEQSGVWYRILVFDERYGWVHGDYITIREDKVSRGAQTSVEEPAVDANKDLRQQIVEYSKKLLGIKYKYGGSTTKGFDCSGFVSYVFKNFGITLPRASRDMGNSGVAVKKENLKPGDLVFFDTNGGLNGINHVGIYIGDGKFIHASSYIGKKVTISSLNDKFYSKSYMRSRDVLTGKK